MAYVVSPDLRDRVRFFLEHAGYSTPPGRVACALSLARAEVWARAEGLQYDEREDERAYCYCDDPRCTYHEGSDRDWETISIALVRPCEEHGTQCKHAEYLGSLGGIMDPGDAYRRVVRAELASEAMPADAPRAPFRVLACDYKKGCRGRVEYLDRSGYVYCPVHASTLRGDRPLRKLRPHELRRLQAGGQVTRY